MFALAIALLAGGAFIHLFGAYQLASRLGANPFALGIVVIPLCVCAPALAVTLTAVASDRHMLAVGTIIGGTILNLGFTLGVAALFRPPPGSSRVVASAIPVMMAATLLFWFLCRDNEVSRVDGVILLSAFAGAVAYLAREARREADAVKAKFAEWSWERRPAWLMGLGLAIGLAGVISGALVMVPAAVEMANKEFTTGTRVFALTIVAVIVSIPAYWLVKSAAYNRHTDLALAIIVGSALCNLLLVAGLAALVAPFGVTERALLDDIPSMALFAFLLLAPLLNGLKLHRWEGVILIAAYLVFALWQVQTAVK